MSSPETDLQRQYYAQTAQSYDSLHMQEEHEHYFALCLMMGVLDHLGARSILDIGSGTGRVIRHVRKMRPELRIVGIEPVEELRKVAYRHGVQPTELVDGDATSLDFADGEFDLVCEFGVLHHIRDADRAVSEMLRVSKRGIFISDSNNFGQGNAVSRSIKQLLNAVRLWKLADLVKTRGRGYTVSEGDGLAYSYSVFDNYRQIRRACRSVHLLNTTAAGINPYRTAGHVALLGIR